MLLYKNSDYVRRAMAAWFRAGNTTQPANYSSVYQAGGRDYVELCNVSGTLAVYRIENSGRLKRLKRWPSADRPVHTSIPEGVATGRADHLPIKETLAAFGAPFASMEERA